MPALAYDAWLVRAAKLKGSDISADGKAIMRALVELMDEAQSVDRYADDVALIPIEDSQDDGGIPTSGERVTRADVTADTQQTK